MATPDVTTAPPPPPPPPPPLPATGQRDVKPSIQLETREPPAGLTFEKPIPKPAPPGLYFFYGTLQEPQFLQKLLSLPDRPTLRPAYITGYEARLWGPYPALVDKEGGVVTGSAYEVPDQVAAQRLQDYETEAYCTEACTIYFGSPDDGEGMSESGFTFKYAARLNDLEDGTFSLEGWARLSGGQLNDF